MDKPKRVVFNFDIFKDNDVEEEFEEEDPLEEE